MEVVHGVDDQNLDLIIHSPGGYITAADAFVQYLRSKFSNIRVIVPQAAMSAATMIACAADEIVMGKHSSLGPIDPQFSMHTSLGVRMIPAQAILDQFERAKEECKDPAKLAAWVPMLQQFGPDLLVQCTNMSVLAFQLVREWLATYMFKDQADRDAKAISVAGWLVNHGEFKTHSRHINRSILLERGLKITNLEDDKFVQDFALSIFHAATITFTHSGAVKIIENHKGNAFLQQVQPVFVEQPAQVRFSPPAVANPNLRPPPFQKKKH